MIQLNCLPKLIVIHWNIIRFVKSIVTSIPNVSVTFGSMKYYKYKEYDIFLPHCSHSTMWRNTVMNGAAYSNPVQNNGNVEGVCVDCMHVVIMMSRSKF